jgi:ABC-type dipeptide/oligopeptide/nickel transport system ATPase component
MTALITFDDVSIRFPGMPAPAVMGVTLSAEKGEFLGLVGESGSGKSTLANAAMGLLPPGTEITGRITVAGQDVTTMSLAELRRMRGDVAAMIFQDASASLDPVWPVGDQIAETVRAHHNTSRRDAKARAIALMEEVGIPDAARRYSEAPHRFSGGMRQRIVIAAALANDPQLLIADEPTTALDVTIQAQVLDLLDRLRRDHGTTVLLITHDLGVVAQVCDRVGVMCKGRLLETASKDRLFTAPNHPYTRALLAANPASAKRGERLPVIPAEWSVESLKADEQRREDEHG